MINACVSHELRNPLNSICAINILNAHLYEKIITIIELENHDPSSLLKIKDIVFELKEGQKVQKASSTMMSFLVQDLLDYAQIKAGKFRKNIVSFDIRKMVEEVMCIQRNEANQK